MKKILLLTTLLIVGLLLTGCIENKWKIHWSEDLTWWYTKNPNIEELKRQQKEKELETSKIPAIFKDINLENIDIRSINLQELKPEELLYLRENIDYSKLSDEDKTYLMIWHDPYDYVEDDGYHIITSHLISDECAYNSDEYGIKLNFNKWNDCKILYQEIKDKNWVNTLKRFSVNSLPIHDKWWFEWYGLLWRVYIVPIDEEVDEHWMDNYNNYFWIEIWENNNYRFYIDVWVNSPSYYYTYYPISYNDFVCDNMKKLDNWTMVDKNWRYCHERDKDWEKLWIDMPNPMLWTYDTTSYKMKEFIQFYDL